MAEENQEYVFIEGNVNMSSHCRNNKPGAESRMHKLRIPLQGGNATYIITVNLQHCYSRNSRNNN